MKSLRFMLPVALLLPCAVGFAQEHAMPKPSAAKSEAQTSFDSLKTLAGEWAAKITVDPPQPQWDTGKGAQIILRVTSRGNAIVHEMQEEGTPLDWTKYDHPVTMLYLDGDRLLLTHYCDAGNRPRMVARTSADGKKVEFNFLDVAGGTEYGHMHHAVFTIIDANHHTEDWTYMTPGDKPIHAHFDLQRSK
jgi:hypothetical protein